MGFRNPFRIGVDPKTGWVLVADYGPDAGATNPNRGPQGSVECNIVEQPGNYGWPYCVRENTPTTTTTSRPARAGRKFNCAAPGQQLAQQHRPDEPAAGPARHDVDGLQRDATRASRSSAPAARRWAARSTGTTRPTNRRRSGRAYYDGKAIIGEWNNGWIKTATLNDDGQRDATWSTSTLGTGYMRPMDMEFGPDGALYMIEWGRASAATTPTPASTGSTTSAGARRPIAHGDGDTGHRPGAADGAVLQRGLERPRRHAAHLRVGLHGDGTTDSTEPNPTHTYTGRQLHRQADA